MSTSATHTIPTQTQPTSQTPSPQGERAANGRFTKGNNGGTGNPYARQSAHFRQVIHGTITDDDMREVVAALLEEAKDGNVQAAKLLLSYAIGKPTDAPDPDRLDLDEWEQLKQEQDGSVLGLGNVLHGFPVEIAVRLATVLIGQFREAFAACLAGNPDLAPGGVEQGKQTMPSATEVISVLPPSTNASNGGEPPVASVSAPITNGFLGAPTVVVITPAPSTNGSIGAPTVVASDPSPLRSGSIGGPPARVGVPAPSINGPVGAPASVARRLNPSTNGFNGDIQEPASLRKALANRANGVAAPSANGFNGEGDDSDDELGDKLEWLATATDPVGDYLRMVQQLRARAQRTPPPTGSSHPGR